MKREATTQEALQDRAASMCQRRCELRLGNGEPAMNCCDVLDSTLQDECCRWTGSMPRPARSLSAGRSGVTTWSECLGKRPPGRDASEAGGSGHCWARKIKALGHEGVLLLRNSYAPWCSPTRGRLRTSVRSGRQCERRECGQWQRKTEDQQATSASGGRAPRRSSAGPCR